MEPEGTQTHAYYSLGEYLKPLDHQVHSISV